MFGAGVFYILRLMSQPPAAGETEPADRRADARRRHHARAGDRCRSRAAGALRSTDGDLDLPSIWAGLIAFAVLAYVVLDGFDLGIGILFPFVAGEATSAT